MCISLEHNKVPLHDTRQWFCTGYRFFRCCLGHSTYFPRVHSHSLSETVCGNCCLIIKKIIVGFGRNERDWNYVTEAWRISVKFVFFKLRSILSLSSREKTTRISEKEAESRKGINPRSTTGLSVLSLIRCSVLLTLVPSSQFDLNTESKPKVIES